MKKLLFTFLSLIVVWGIHTQSVKLNHCYAKRFLDIQNCSDLVEMLIFPHAKSEYLQSKLMSNPEIHLDLDVFGLSSKIWFNASKGI
ncbi:hypothetical protein [Aureibacter tunicatorum]|uniref:Uncharacterized protein n=1 Tax=Aureibacter tunicatorum TaxID=866807 RepID=A0AAE3XS90_9BACT|nr:hypothetical protein [Aureibacter tunicatorum]MDR6241079.1 hypothetical protein [Aureibacter tunicatorum]BDD03857.1 hypothetical protein AUTU_13400 [Aureibacter tunicatorum]